MSSLHNILVVKIGGATLGSHDTTIEDIVELQKRGKPLVVVHGGGKVITDWLTRLGVKTRFVRGERVTDEASLEVVVAVLGGLVNKEIVAEINNLGGRAVGITGADGAFVQGKVRDAQMGYVGEIVKINLDVVKALMGKGFVPVVAPIGLYYFDRDARAPQLLNINADIMAGEIASTIGAEKLVFLTDVTGILDSTGALLPELGTAEAEALITSGVASAGMIPKVKACLRALAGNAISCIIDGRQPHALLRELEGHNSGTVIINKE